MKVLGFPLLLAVLSCAHRIVPHPDPTPLYALPFAEGVKSRLFQGWGGGFSHRGAHRFAVDFRLEPGTAVCAARAGRVLQTEARFRAGGNDRSLLDRANFVTVDHGDGTYAEYYHLAPDSVAVAVGEEVQLGQILGRSGETGYATLPHLHFMIFRRDPKTKIKVSLPFYFRDRAGRALLPEEGKNYAP